jgi:transcription antitermination factor NusG
MEKSWHAIYVKSRTEKKVGETLTEKRIENYVPLIKTMRQWSDRKKMVTLPLLNGYVFVSILPVDQEKVLQTKGVVNFVRQEGKIAVVRAIEINRLRQLVELGYDLEAGAIARIYKEGDKIKIRAGSLKGIEGYVIENRGEKKIEVLLQSIGQCIRVRLPKELLSTIERSDN